MATSPGRLAELSADGSVLATAGAGQDAGSVLLWDAATGRALRELTGGHFLGVSALAFSPDGSRLASGGYDGQVMIWNTATGKPDWTPLKAAN